MKNDDLISRKAAILIAERYGCNNGSVLGHHSGVADCIASEIDALPAVDAAPVVHARWEPSDDYNGYCRCSVCHDTYIDPDWIIDGKWQYCPSCGAKMDGERRDDE